MKRILHSLVGRTFRAIRGNEELAEAVGIHAMRVKILSFTTSCFFAGIGGVLYASYIGFLSPELTDYHVSFDSLVYIMIGGVGTMAGPIVGTLLFVTIPETLHVAAEYRLLALRPDPHSHDHLSSPGDCGRDRQPQGEKTKVDP